MIVIFANVKGWRKGKVVFSLLPVSLSFGLFVCLFFDSPELSVHFPNPRWQLKTMLASPNTPEEKKKKTQATKLITVSACVSFGSWHSSIPEIFHVFMVFGFAQQTFACSRPTCLHRRVASACVLCGLFILLHNLLGVWCYWTGEKLRWTDTRYTNWSGINFFIVELYVRSNGFLQSCILVCNALVLESFVNKAA